MRRGGWIFVVFLFSALTSACMPVRRASEPTQPPVGAYTAAAGTVVARFTLQAGQTAVAQLTALAATTPAPPVPSPTADLLPTLPPVTELPPAADTLAPTEPTLAPPTLAPPTPVPPLPSATPAIPLEPCDRAELIADVTVPPDTVLLAGSTFNKTWRVRNAGSCEWTGDYALIYTGGNLPASGPSTFLPGRVAPGGVIDLSLPLVAPTLAGQYFGEWMLRNASGSLFGTGPVAAFPLQLRFRTVQPATNTGGYDLAASYCTASWRSSNEALLCPGSPADPNGSISLVENPELETGRRRGYALWTRPQAVSGGWIQGLYPAYVVQAGDHFLAELACLQGNPGCELTFQFGYQQSNGAFQRLGQWRETSDGRSTPVSVDLSGLAGYAVIFGLAATNNGQAAYANGVWLQPRIVRQDRSLYTLIWERQSTNEAACQELRLLITAGNSGEAQAYDCNPGGGELGRIRLDLDETEQLLDWAYRLADFDAEVYAVDGNQPVISWLDFQGLGGASATSDDIAAMNLFAFRLYALIVR